MRKSACGFAILFLFAWSGMASAQQLEWATRAGGTGTDEAHAVVVDAEGNSYVTGHFSGTADFGGHPLYGGIGGDDDIFVAKYSADGRVLWARREGSSLSDAGTGVAVDGAGHVYVTGYMTSGGVRHVFTAKYDSSNGSPVWFTYSYDGAGNDVGYGVAVDPVGNVYVTGSFYGTARFGSSSLSGSTHSVDATAAGDATNSDFFLAKYDSNGGLQWVKTGGGTSEDSGRSVAVDSSGHIYVTGYFHGIATFAGSSIVAAAAGDAQNDDMFLAKYDSGATLHWVKQAGGTSTDVGLGLAVDEAGNSYVTGYFTGTATFAEGVTQIASGGAQDRDVYVARYTSAGSFAWVKQIGGTGTDIGHAMAVDGEGNSYVTGYFFGSATFGPGVTLTVPGGYSIADMFTAKHDTAGALVWAKQAGGVATDVGAGIAVDGAGSSYVTGYFVGTAWFDSATSLTSASSTAYDVFLAKYGPENAAPVITAGASLERQQGSGPGAAVTIATVSDPDTPAGDLVVSVRDAPPGITVHPPIVNTNGTITAAISASCEAAVGIDSVTFEVSDGVRTAIDKLTLNVTANTAPTLGTYPTTAVGVGGMATVVPSAPPADNGAVNVMAAEASKGFTGTVSVDIVTGEVAITNAGPAGTYAITVAAVDNCGVKTETFFTLTVQPPSGPTNVSGTLPGNAQWVLAGSPYIVNADVTVPEGGTLRIDPGVEVRFLSGTALRVHGLIDAAGTAAEPIRFTSNVTPPAAGNWAGILLFDSTVDAQVDAAHRYTSGSRLEHVEIAYGGGIYVEDSFPYLASLWIHHTQAAPAASPLGCCTRIGAVTFSYGRNTTPNLRLVIRDSLINDNPTRGIGGRGTTLGSVVILNNQILNNTGGGLAVADESSNFTYRANNNRVAGNRSDWGGGIYIVRGDGGTVLDGNQFVGNTATDRGGAIAIYAGSPVIKGNLIQGNVASGGGRGGGALFAQSGAPQLTYNTFAVNQAANAAVVMNSVSGASLQGSNFIGNTGAYDVLMGDFGRGHVDARSSYWGTGDPAVIAARIWDYYDDFIPGIVDTAGMLAAPEPHAPAIEVPAANVAPLADAGTTQNVTAGALITLDGRRSFDLNGDPLGFLWTEAPGNPDRGVLVPPMDTSVRPAFTARTPGIYQFTLVVSDGQATSAPATVTIKVFAGGTMTGGFLGMTTWTRAMSPVIVTSSLLLESSKTLTIEPGVEVRFEPGTFLRVEGELVALGIETAPIRFTSNAPAPATGAWQGIVLGNTAVDAVIDPGVPGDPEGEWRYLEGSTLQHVEIAYGGGLYIEDSYPYLANLWIHDTTAAAAARPLGCCTRTGAVTFSYSNGGSPAGTLVLRDSRIVGNPTRGIGGRGTVAGTVQILDNQIRNNTGGGLAIADESGSFSYVARGNILSGNRSDWGGGIFILRGDANTFVQFNEFLDNTATDRGGAIAIYGGSPNIHFNLFQGNTVSGSFGRGGSALFAQGSALEATRNTFAMNRAPGGATVVLDFSRGVNLSSSNFIGNVSAYDVLLGTSARGNIDARLSYWGTEDPNAIAARIFDYHDDGIPGIVDFAGFLQSPDPDTPAAWQQLRVDPANPVVGPGSVVQFRAIAGRTDNTLSDVTANAVWTSSNPAVATITSSGLATVGSTEGSTTISASMAGLLASTTLTMALPNEPPVASLRVSGVFVPGGTVTFDARESSDRDGQIVAYSWDFDDGQARTAVTSDMTHAYALPGTYTVTLTVTDNDGATGSTRVDVTIVEPVSTTINLSTSTAESPWGRPLQLAAEALWPEGSEASGAVDFFDQSVVPERRVGSGWLFPAPGMPNKGLATLLVASLDPGRYTFVARFAGTPYAKPSESAPVDVIVTRQMGTARAWGKNEAGQLGDGTTVPQWRPVSTLSAEGGPLANIVSLANGSYHTLALDADGTVWASGYNAFGQLGDGTTFQRSIPVQVLTPEGSPLNGIIAVAAGSYHSLALDADGNVYAWGMNASGQLGDGGTTPQSFSVSARIGGVVAIAAGGNHSLALRSDGTAWAWGDNGNGQLGDSLREPEVQSSVPVQVGDLRDLVAIAAGSQHSLALRNDGVVWAWGYNGEGELGDGTTISRSFPALVRESSAVTTPLSNIVEITSGGFHSMARRADGGVWTWGGNYWGQIGDGTIAHRSFPVPVTLADGSSLSDAVAISALSGSSVAIRSTDFDLDGTPESTVWTWGYNVGGQLGDGTDTNRWNPVAVLTATGIPQTAFAIGVGPAGAHTLVLTSNEPPTAAAAAVPNQAEATSASGTEVLLDGSGSVDPDGDPLTYVWRDALGMIVAQGVTPQVTVPLGAHRFELTVTDSHGESATATVTVEVVDTTPPVLALPAITTEATGPRGTIVSLTANWSVTAQDIVDGALEPTCVLADGTLASGSMFPVGATPVECWAIDAAGNGADDSFEVVVKDSTTPVLTIVRPRTDDIVTSAILPVYVEASDAVGITTVRVNGAVAALDSGSPQSGTWRADVQVPYEVPAGGPALYFKAEASDAADNIGFAPTVVVDNDGIAAAIDKELATGADESGFFSGQFVYGTTRGFINYRGGGTLHVFPAALASHVDVFAWNLTDRASVNVCQGATKLVFLDRDGERARISCGATLSTVTVTALNALPDLLIRKEVAPGYWVEMALTAGNSVSTGSPVMADPDNTAPVVVRIIQTDEHGNEVVVGSYQLDSGETVDVEVLTGENGEDDQLSITVLAGEVTFTITGQTLTLGQGQSAQPVVDQTPPSIGETSDVVVEATSAAGASVAYPLPPIVDAVDPQPTIVSTPAVGSMFALGTTTVTITATDAAGNSASKTFSVTVRDTTAPAISLPADLVVTCAGLSPDGRGCVTSDDRQVTAWLDQATASDIVDGDLEVDHILPALLPPGFTTVTFTATDAAGNTAQRTGRVQVVYDFDGFLPPLLGEHQEERHHPAHAHPHGLNGSASIQQSKAGRTIPIKFQLTCADGTLVATAVATMAVYKLVDGATGSVDTTDLTSDAGSSNESGNLFRFDGKQYIYNLNTKGWSAPATYRIVVTLDDGTEHSIDFSLR